MSLDTPEKLAEFFHETYETLAPSHGYQTREASAKPWSSVPEQNRKLMISTCERVLGRLRLNQELSRELSRELKQHAGWQDLLTHMHPESTIENVSGTHAAEIHGYARTERGLLCNPIYVVRDGNRDSIGRGLTAEGARCDAIRRTYDDLQGRFDELREHVIDKLRAEAAIAKLVGAL